MRKAERVRKTNETDIELAFTIDGGGQADIKTDVPFMTHMLDLFTNTANSIFPLTQKAMLI